MHLSKFRSQITCIFLAAELILYYLILTTGGSILIASSYSAILLCFIFALLHWKDGNRFVIAGLFCTAMADLFLVVCDPLQRLPGMLCFLCAQTLYAITLHLSFRSKKLVIARIVTTLIALIAALAILREKTDVLALVSVCYYANLILNIITAFSRNRWFALALVLFALCDTVIGLQVMSSAYLPIGENSLMYKIIFTNFNLAWFFYLPSQVLIALHARKCST